MKSRQMALCGLLAALAVTLLIAGGSIGIGTFAAPILAMLILLPVLEEFGPKTAVVTYAAAALLGLLLVPEPELALVFAAFGWYPILRPLIARLPSKLLQAAVRLLLCNGILAVLYGLLLRLIGLTSDLAGNARWMNVLMLVMANFIFLLLDPVLSRMTDLWHGKLRKRFFR